MRKVQLGSIPIELKSLIKRSAREADTEIVFSDPGVFYDGDAPVIIYGKLQEKHDPLRWAIDSIKYTTGKRTLGLLSTSRIFGFKPRITIRQDFCAAASLAHTHPKQHAIVSEFGKVLAGIYEHLDPEKFKEHLNQVSSVLPEWILPGTPFTSGIINENNPLKYHFDSGNFNEVKSCMVVFCKDTEGGMLSIPQYNCRFVLEDGAYFLFDGQSILHGVTPIKKKNDSAYRKSIVYYSLKQMKNCGTCLEELNRIRKVKMQREHKRIKNE